MKKIVIFSCFSFLAVFVFAAFPVETQNLLTEADPEKFKLDVWVFLIGILTLLLLPYSLLLLFIRKKNFRGSLAWGWLAGLVLIILLVIAIELVQSGGLLLY
ncbi:MAG: hypothetical protein H8D33_03935 [Cryomorphaceae bacterium]|nr:hypothetical protein [Cryomorphaceae bacterium]